MISFWELYPMSQMWWGLYPWLVEAQTILSPVWVLRILQPTDFQEFFLWPWVFSSQAHTEMYSAKCSIWPSANLWHSPCQLPSSPYSDMKILAAVAFLKSDLLLFNSMRLLGSVGFPLHMLQAGNCLWAERWVNCKANFVSFSQELYIILWYLLCNVKTLLYHTFLPSFQIT